MKGFGKWECGTKFAHCFLSSIDSRCERGKEESKEKAASGRCWVILQTVQQGENLFEFFFI